VTLPVREWGLPAGYVPYLSASSGGNSRFHERAGEFPHLHPNRLVRTYPNGMNVSFSPEEEAPEQALLMDFRFSCITQLSPCRNAGDILPEGWRMLQEQQHQASTR
jgi:hypothetical protein